MGEGDGAKSGGGGGGEWEWKLSSHPVSFCPCIFGAPFSFHRSYIIDTKLKILHFIALHYIHLTQVKDVHSDQEDFETTC